MAKIKRTNLSKSDMKHLPKVNGNDFKEKCAYYTELIFTRVSKPEAFKTAFPDKYEKVLANTKDDRFIKANIAKAINQVEQTEFMQECFYAANKHWWMKFLGKKQEIFENVYEMAMDKEASARDRLSASKIFLDHVPDAPKETNINVKVEVGSNEFKDMLLEKKQALMSAANDIIDVETEEDETN